MNNPQQLLQQTLSKWQRWQVEGLTLSSPPQLIRELSGGRTNRSFLVASGDFQAVIRINAANSHSLGIDRNREQKIFQLLQHTGAVPKLFYADNQAMVSEYCKGKHWQDSAENRRNLNSTLAQIQAIAVPDLEKRNYVDYCTAYINQLDNDSNTGLVNQGMIKAILSAASAIDNSDWKPVICHHDLVPENIIVTAQGPKLLDWEYAAMGHPALDFVRLFHSDLSSSKLAYDSHTLKLLATVQRGMDDLWSLVQK